MKQLWIKITGTIAALALSVSLGIAADPAKPATKDAKAPAKAAAPAKADAAKPADTKAAKQEPVDINSATDAELKAIPGIGEMYSTKIIVGRPYANKTQLKSKGILPDKVYEQVKDRIIAKQAKKDDKAKAAKPEAKKK